MSIIQACLEGDVPSVKAAIKAKAKFDPNAFIIEVFASASDLITKYTTATDRRVCVWGELPVRPLPSPFITAIELVLRAHHSSFNAEMVNMILIYACCTHNALVPVVLELFKDQLQPDQIMLAIILCEVRYPETCWLIMTSCLDLLSGFADECFNVCCGQNNLSMLKLVIGRFGTEFDAYVRNSEYLNISIDTGIQKCCSYEDMMIVQFLATECGYLKPRLLLGCAIHKNIKAAELVFSKYKQIVKPLDWTIEVAFGRAVGNCDTAMLKLFVTELGDKLPHSSKERAFTKSCTAGDVETVKMLIECCPQDLKYEYGFVSSEIITDEVWVLMAGLFDERLQRMDDYWCIACTKL